MSDPVAAPEGPGARARAKLEGLRRTAWLPLVASGDGPAHASKLSGLAAVPASEGWPVCGLCDRPMQLFVQLDSRSLPPEAGEPFGPGILQLFYCTNVRAECEVKGEGWAAGSAASLARVVPLDWQLRRLDRSPVEGAFSPKRIVGWEPADDYPNWEEAAALGVELDDEEIEAIVEEAPVPGEKLGGWPYWVQGVEYPPCPECGGRMELVFQLDSECNLPYSFGDAGCGHVTRCPEHPARLAFAWACC